MIIIEPVMIWFALADSFIIFVTETHGNLPGFKTVKRIWVKDGIEREDTEMDLMGKRVIVSQIVDLNRDRITIINHQKKTYRVEKIRCVERSALEEGVKASAKGVKIKLKKTNKKKEILGHDARVWVLKILYKSKKGRYKFVYNLWTVDPESKLGKALSELHDFNQRLSTRLGFSAGHQAVSRRLLHTLTGMSKQQACWLSAQLSKELQRLDGVIAEVEAQLFKNGKKLVEVVRKVEEYSVSNVLESVFSVPEGYSLEKEAK